MANDSLDNLVTSGMLKEEPTRQKSATPRCDQIGSAAGSFS